jgi:hypothetical protein
MRVFAGVLVVLLAGSTTGARAAEPTSTDAVTIYRCTDADGRLTLRDTPCRKDQKQQTRTMLRPHDAPPPPRVAAPQPAGAPVAATAPAIEYRVPARPMYECVPPDGGEPYTSDNDAGNPRWVPFWTLGFPIASPRPRRGDGHDHHDMHDGRPDTGLAITGGEVRIEPGRTTLRRPVFGAAAFGAGTWVRDDCHALPQDDACARLADRRDAIRNRFFNAMPSERDVLRVEERAITARLGNDCGSR